MGLFTHALTGGGLILIGAWEVFISSYTSLHPSSSPTHSPPHQTQTPSSSRTNINKFLYSVRFVSIAIFSSIFIIDSLVSLFDAHENKDRVGFALQLEIISIVSLFLLYSVYGLLCNFVQFPSSLLNLIALFGFGQEFLHFYVQRKDPEGIENRYFDLLLVPITACVFTTVLDMGEYKSSLANLGRGVGLILQGMWFVQMGFSFFTNAIAHGCSLIEKSRGNFTVLCKGHMAGHRSMAIATLQFNCHLALLVIMSVVVYAFVVHKFGMPGDYSNYKPLNAELQELGHQNEFTLDSDDDDVVEENVSNGLNPKDAHSEAVTEIPLH